MPRPHAPRTRVSSYVSDWISRINTVDYLVVAGGGGGGFDSGAGGGGAGGLLYGTTKIVSSSSYTITIGTGGAGATTAAGGGQANGTNSVFGILTALGGGYGASYQNFNYPTDGGRGGNGGSGGGGSVWYSAGTTSIAGTGTSGQGNSGGVAQTADLSN